MRTLLEMEQCFFWQREQITVVAIDIDVSFIAKGLFTRCDFFIVTNGLYGIQDKYSHGAIFKMTLDPMQPINRDK